MSVQDEIAHLVKAHPVLLFMKGQRTAPQCGFSARVVGILDDYLPEYRTVDVLSAPEIREGIKEFSSWPTIPQLYVKGEFIGGCDIVTEMSENGELGDVLGVKLPELKTPEIGITPQALEKLRAFADGDAIVVRLEVTARWQYGLDFDSARPTDVVVEGPGWTVVMDRNAARKSDGLSIDFVVGPEGEGFKITNPNEPPKVKQANAKTIKEWLDGGKPFEFFDVRTQAERDTASIKGAVLLEDAEGTLKNLDRGTTLVFHCHHGGRSQRAAQHALDMGFVEVYNLAGGIDAWSQDVDDAVPRY
ncbi:MAG: Grx4 family monothiol glutaredoxin [Myxococcota bacterium]